MVRSGMVRIGDADLGIRSRAGFTSQLKGDNPGDVSLQGEHLQVEHQARVIGVSSRYAHWAIQIRHPRIGRLGLSFLNAALHLANGIQILGYLAAVTRAELLLQPGNIFTHPIEKAQVFPQLGAAVRHAASLAEQALKNYARMSLSRKRRRRRRPGEIVLIHTGVSVVTLT